MLFNSFNFLVFFVFFFFLYWFVFGQNFKTQNLLLLVANYVFIAWVDWRFLMVLVVSSLIYFLLGIRIEKSENEKEQRVLLLVGLICGIGQLVYFKYLNFFIDSLTTAFSVFSPQLNNYTNYTLKIIAPIGISFYTFRALGYLIDVHNGKIASVNNWIIFFTYLSFFPCIVSGPIDRARDFIPQLEKERVFQSDKISDGLRQILWGLFKKVVIANNCHIVVSQIFDGYQQWPASTLVFGAFFYAIELYADFSGYSDIAIGISRLIGFNVAKNFDFPFFAQNIADFWRRWHISLTSWMTEYVFTPLSFTFRKLGSFGTILAIIINFILISLWHGANGTFLVYGFLHGCYFIPLILKGKVNSRIRVTTEKFLPSGKEFLRIAGTFTLVMFTLIFFRSRSIEEALNYFVHLFSMSIFYLPNVIDDRYGMLLLFFISLMFLVEWIGKRGEYAIERLGLRWNKPLRWSMYYLFIYLILYYINTGQAEFIYAQF